MTDRAPYGQRGGTQEYRPIPPQGSHHVAQILSDQLSFSKRATYCYDTVPVSMILMLVVVLVYPASSGHPVFVSRDILILWTHTVRRRKTKKKHTHIQVSSK